MAAHPEMTHGTTPDYPSNLRAWTLIALLMIANIFSFIDRQILGLLVDPVRHTMAITDFQIGLLIGPAFAIFYSFMALPIGRLVDSWRRVTIIAIGVGLWSLMTILSGAANSFAWLMAARIGVAVGEACLFPAAHSLIPDAFPPERRARAIGTYSISIYLGAGLAFIFGGLLTGWAESDGLRQLVPAAIAARAPWQIVFFLVGAPGLLLAIIFLFLKEPHRHDYHVDKEFANKEPLRLFLRSHGLLFATIAIGNAMATLTSYSLFAWAPTYLVRTAGLARQEAGLMFGLAVVLGGIIGIVSATRYADYRWSAGARGTKFQICGTACTAAILFAILLPFAKAPLPFVIVVGGLLTCASMVIGLAPAALQEIVPNKVRGRLLAGVQLAATLIGAGMGPPAVALAMHASWNSTADAGVALAVICGAGMILGAFAFFFMLGRFTDAVRGRDAASIHTRTIA
jgi:MFS family permease